MKGSAPSSEKIPVKETVHVWEDISEQDCQYFCPHEGYF